MCSPRKKDVGGNSESKSESGVPELEDKEFQLASCVEEMEDETTIEEEERLEGLVDHEVEVNALKEEGKLLFGIVYVLLILVMPNFFL